MLESSSTFESIKSLKLALDQAKETNDSRVIAQIFKFRLISRLVEPALAIPVDNRHGFLMTSVACQAIEAYVAFREGKESTKDISHWCFSEFFRIHRGELRDKMGPDSKSCFDVVKSEFFKNVRCGLLHQAETRNGWTIRRSGKIFSRAPNGGILVNGTALLNFVKSCINNYARDVEVRSFEDESVKNILRVLDAVVNRSTIPDKI